jgi:hypothetical protein
VCCFVQLLNRANVNLMLAFMSKSRPRGPFMTQGGDVS